MLGQKPAGNLPRLLVNYDPVPIDYINFRMSGKIVGNVSESTRLIKVVRVDPGHQVIRFAGSLGESFGDGIRLAGVRRAGPRKCAARICRKPEAGGRRLETGYTVHRPEPASHRLGDGWSTVLCPPSTGCRLPSTVHHGFQQPLAAVRGPSVLDHVVHGGILLQHTPHGFGKETRLVKTWRDDGESRLGRPGLCGGEFLRRSGRAA